MCKIHIQYKINTRREILLCLKTHDFFLSVYMRSSIFRGAAGQVSVILLLCKIISLFASTKSIHAKTMLRTHPLHTRPKSKHANLTRVPRLCAYRFHRSFYHARSGQNTSLFFRRRKIICTIFALFNIYAKLQIRMPRIDMLHIDILMRTPRTRKNRKKNALS